MSSKCKKNEEIVNKKKPTHNEFFETTASEAVSNDALEDHIQCDKCKKKILVW